MNIHLCSQLQTKNSVSKENASIMSEVLVGTWKKSHIIDLGISYSDFFFKKIPPIQTIIFSFKYTAT